MISSPGRGIDRLLSCAAGLLLGVVGLSGTALVPSHLQAQPKEKEGDGHTKRLAQDVAQLKEVFKNQVVTVEVSTVAGGAKFYAGRIVGVRQILGERFLELGRPEEGGFAGDTRTLINWKTIVAIRQP